MKTFLVFHLQFWKCMSMDSLDFLGLYVWMIDLFKKSSKTAFKIYSVSSWTHGLTSSWAPARLPNDSYFYYFFTNIMSYKVRFYLPFSQSNCYLVRTFLEFHLQFWNCMSLDSLDLSVLYVWIINLFPKTSKTGF